MKRDSARVVLLTGNPPVLLLVAFTVSNGPEGWPPCQRGEADVLLVFPMDDHRSRDEKARDPRSLTAFVRAQCGVSGSRR